MPRTTRQDPNLKPGTPTKPANLSDRAAREWDRLTSELEDSQIQVATAHRALLSLAATIAADIADAWEVVKDQGAYITNKKTGAVQVHPASKTLNELRRDYIKVLTALGTRAVAAPPPKTGRTLADILNEPVDSEIQR